MQQDLGYVGRNTCTFRWNQKLLYQHVTVDVFALWGCGRFLFSALSICLSFKALKEHMLLSKSVNLVFNFKVDPEKVSIVTRLTYLFSDWDTLWENNFFFFSQKSLVSISRYLLIQSEKHDIYFSRYYPTPPSNSSWIREWLGSTNRRAI